MRVCVAKDLTRGDRRQAGQESASRSCVVYRESDDIDEFAANALPARANREQLRTVPAEHVHRDSWNPVDSFRSGRATLKKFSKNIPTRIQGSVRAHSLRERERERENPSKWSRSSAFARLHYFGQWRR